MPWNTLLTDTVNHDGGILRMEYHGTPYSLVVQLHVRVYWYNNNIIITVVGCALIPLAYMYELMDVIMLETECMSRLFAG